MSVRAMHFNGSFYPADAKEILNYFDHFNKIIEEHTDISDNLHPRALIVPHAGYVYSGFTANIAYRFAALETYHSVVVIGPSHHHYFKGISVAAQTEFQTPLGDLEIDTDLVETLQKNFDINYVPEAHKEHSTEVQMPFVKHYLGHAKVVELVYSDFKPAQLEPIITDLLQKPAVLVVISTDLSHFYTLEEAKKFDSVCLNAIDQEDTDILHQGCEACGKIGVEALLLSAKKLQLHNKLLDYRTSADASGDTQRVVGYTSALFY